MVNIAFLSRTCTAPRGATCKERPNYDIELGSRKEEIGFAFHQILRSGNRVDVCVAGDSLWLVVMSGCDNILSR